MDPQSLLTDTRQARLRARIPGSAPLVWRARHDRPVVALTFDDGPDPEGTPAVLDALGDAGARATFFLLTTRATAAPGLVARIVADGHEVALHADRHERLDRVGIGPLARRLAGARAELEDLAGRAVRFHRPPYGRLSWRGLQAARRAGLAVALWSHDPRDFEAGAGTRDRIAACLVPGAVVLLHDGADGRGGQGRATAGALAEVLPLLPGRGLRTVTVAEL